MLKPQNNEWQKFNIFGEIADLLSYKNVEMRSYSGVTGASANTTDNTRSTLLINYHNLASQLIK